MCSVLNLHRYLKTRKLHKWDTLHWPTKFMLIKTIQKKYCHAVAVKSRNESHAEIQKKNRTILGAIWNLEKNFTSFKVANGDGMSEEQTFITRNSNANDNQRNWAANRETSLFESVIKELECYSLLLKRNCSKIFLLRITTPKPLSQFFPFFGFFFLSVNVKILYQGNYGWERGEEGKNGEEFRG